jgi:hypothetical protein
MSTHVHYGEAMTTTNAQAATETFWKIATSDDVNIASSDSPVYRAAEKALISAIREEHGVSLKVARAARQLLSEYGPDDSLTGTYGHRGMTSYVIAALKG